MKSAIFSLLFSGLALAQSTSVNKAPGEDYFIKLTFPTNVTVSGFDVVQEAKGAASIETVVQVFTPTQRQTVGLRAPLLGGTYYYVVRAWTNVTAGGLSKKVYGKDSNEVSVTVYVLPVGVIEVQ